MGNQLIVQNMKLQEIAGTIDGKIITSVHNGSMEYKMAFASDLMSDVLTLSDDNLVLITGLANMQTIRTAEMADINCIIFVRNKKVTKEMAELAKESGIDIIECSYSMFRTSGLLFKSGLQPVY